MTRKRDRIFAFLGAMLFLVTASALTIAVIVSGINSHNNKSTSNTDLSAQQAAVNCPQTSVSASAETKPEIYKTTDAAKEIETTDLVAGNGATVKSGDCLQVKYLGSVAKDGMVFDENFDQTTALQFLLGQGQVIQGWDQGLIGAKVGGIRRLVIPAVLAYANQPPDGSGIPANADLVFTVKILSAK